MASEVEDTLKRIQSHRGVIGTIVVNNEGGCCFGFDYEFSTYVMMT